MLLEVCVDTIEGAKAAIAGGAGRIELCSALSEGGLTPSAGMMQAAAGLAVPVYAMIRPRSGLFHFTAAEAEIMSADIAAARAAGLAGVVLGAQDESSGLDMPLMERLCQQAEGMGRSLHRVIDVVPDPLRALDQAIALGFERVLTSGAQPLAPDGAAMIARMVERSADRISVMPGCGLDAGNVRALIAATGVSEVHAACSRALPDKSFSDFSPPGGRFTTSEADVTAMVAAMSDPGP